MSGTLLMSLFLAAFLSANIVPLPMQSEAVLAGMLAARAEAPWLLVAVASLGNVLGATVNWFVGRGIERFRHRRWFPGHGADWERAQRWYQRYGKWSLLASWLPVVGDPLTLVAGVLREPLPVFLLLVTLAKTLRYVVLALVVLGVT